MENQRVVERSVSREAALSFSEHIRDFITCGRCEMLHLDVITCNTRHFELCQGIKVMVPEEFVTDRIQ
ncbi:MAG: hypothetical protein GYA24_25520 [Candidatus Lokiarchaeota archaeon]|nr:hypothetical protein [Candidatus Lokiarchaeota archaeon]